MPNELKQNGWAEGSRHVLLELERHNGLLEKIIEGQSKLDKRITIIEVKSGVWGALGGSIGSAILLLILRSVKVV